MKSLEHYVRQTKRAAESAFADEYAKEQTASENLTALFDGNGSKFNRTVALLSLVRAVAPFDLKYNYQSEHLAVDPKNYEFKEGAIGRGGENDVYLLEAKEAAAPSWVLKVNRQDKGDNAQLLARAKEIKADYEEIKAWFADMPGLIPDEYTVIMEDPRDAKASIVTLQPYYGRGLKDVFQEISPDSAAETFQNNPGLKQEIQKFLQINEEKFASTGNMVDLLGAKNLCLVNAGRQDRLLVVDPHLISNPYRSEESAKRKQRERLNYLHSLVGVAPESVAPEIE